LIKFPQHLPKSLIDLLKNNQINKDTNISSYYKCTLLVSNIKLSDITTKSFIKPLFTTDKKLTITGKIINSVTLMPLTNAHLVINSNPIEIDSTGCFEISNMDIKGSCDFFVSAEGYRSYSFKQGIFKDSLQIRLKPKTTFGFAQEK